MIISRHIILLHGNIANAQHKLVDCGLKTFWYKNIGGLAALLSKVAV